MDPEWLPFGVLGRPHGVSGAITLRPFVPESGALGHLSLPFQVEVGLADCVSTYSVVGLRSIPAGGILSLAGVVSREQATRLTGGELRLARAALPPLGPGEFYVGDLLGCEAIDTAGRSRGRVRGIYWNGAQDVMVVGGEDGTDALVPVVPAFIRRLDRAASRVLVDFHE